jgi:hypothetical protein
MELKVVSPKPSPMKIIVTETKPNFIAMSFYYICFSKPTKGPHVL